MTVHAVHDEEYAGQFDLGLWRRMLRHASPYRRPLIGLAASGLVVAALDVGFPMVTGGLIDAAVEQGSVRAMVPFAAAYGVLILGFVVAVWAFILFAGMTATGLAYDLRRDGFARLQDLSFSYFDKRPVGWLVTRLTSDCSKLSSLVPWFMLDLFWGTSMLLGITGAMLWLNWRLALVVLVIVPPLVVATIVFQRRLLRSSRAIRRTNSQLTASFSECIMGVGTTKALVREDRNLEEFQVQSAAMRMHSVRNALQSAVYLPIVISLGSVGIGLALWRGGLLLGSEDGMTVGALVAFMQYATLYSMPVQELAARFTDLQNAQAAAERVQGLLDTEPEIKDAPEVVARLAANGHAPAADGLAPDGHPDAIEEIRFAGVDFWYEPGEPVLSNFDLTVRAGQTIALVGATGGGKSTIVSLVSRFYEPCAGSILIDGIDYRERGLSWLQSKLGIVLQTPHLFSETIRENIRYGNLAASDADIERAARLVNAHEFVSALPDGYDTSVGEGGARLSTGQRQLIALARAVVADPTIFIMDEATSSVDTETERLIQAGIERVLEGRIAFVIAHRLSTIRSADVILVIERGRIVEQGTHEELIRLRGAYFRLYTEQFVRGR